MAIRLFSPEVMQLNLWRIWALIWSQIPFVQHFGSRRRPLFIHCRPSFYFGSRQSANLLKPGDNWTAPTKKRRKGELVDGQINRRWRWARPSVTIFTYIYDNQSRVALTPIRQNLAKDRAKGLFDQYCISMLYINGGSQGRWRNFASKTEKAAGPSLVLFPGFALSVAWEINGPSGFCEDPGRLYSRSLIRSVARPVYPIASIPAPLQ